MAQSQGWRFFKCVLRHILGNSHDSPPQINIDYLLECFEILDRKKFQYLLFFILIQSPMNFGISLECVIP